MSEACPHQTISDSLDFHMNSVYDHSNLDFASPEDIVIQPQTISDIPRPTKVLLKRPNPMDPMNFHRRSMYSPRPYIRRMKPMQPLSADNLSKPKTPARQCQQAPVTPVSLPDTSTNQRQTKFRARCIPDEIPGSLRMYQSLDFGVHPVEFGGIQRRNDYNNMKNLNL
jgi:Protein of unknown function (DUF3695).